MGNTTIIEIDHDRAHEIDDNQDTFIRCVLEQCRAATHTGQRIPGGRVVAFFHRSGPLEEAWEKYKRELREITNPKFSDGSQIFPNRKD